MFHNPPVSPTNERLGVGLRLFGMILDGDRLWWVGNARGSVSSSCCVTPDNYPNSRMTDCRVGV